MIKGIGFAVDERPNISESAEYISEEKAGKLGAGDGYDGFASVKFRTTGKVVACNI